MIRSVRRVGWLLAFLLCAPPLTGPATGGVCPHRLDVFLVRRVGTAPRPLKMSFVLDPISDLATLFVLPLREQRVVTSNVMYVIDGTNHVRPAVYSRGGFQALPGAVLPPVATPVNVPPGTLCEVVGRERTPLNLVDRETTTDDFLVAGYDENMTIEVSPGWTVTRLDGGVVTMITGNGTSTGMAVGDRRVEHFQGTPRVPGGRWGSVAFASLPCTMLVPVSAGVGSGTLLGGEAERTMTCGPGDMPFDDAAVNGPTTWQVVGEAVGWTTINRRLIVFDLPQLRP